MTRMVKVRVTAEHIAFGIRGKFDSCPVALALEEAFRTSPRECGVTLLIFIPGYRNLPTPARVERWVDAFDAGETVQPFTFTLTVSA